MLDQPVYDYRVYDGSSVQRVTLKALDCISVFDETEAFYRARGMGNAFYGELLYDRMFHYLLWMERLPRLGTKEERRQMEAAFEQSRRALDFSAAQNDEDVTALVRAFDRRMARRAWYESNAYAALYRAARAAKHRLKR